MPVEKVKWGYRFGKSWKIYRWKDAKKKAAKQGVAIKISQSKNLKK